MKVRFLFFVLLASCSLWWLESPAAEVQPESEQEARVISALEQSPATAQLSEALEEVRERVEALRGLEFIQPIRWGVKTQVQFAQMIAQELAKDWPDEEIRGTTKALVKLGVWPEDKDLKEELLKLLGEEVAAFYHPESKHFYFIGSCEGFMLRITAAHELTHVLQDQHFDLEKLPLKEKHNSDRALACLALIEGDATALMLDFWLGKDTSKEAGVGPTLARMMNLSGSYVMGDVPAFLRENLLFPYVWGLLFVQQARQQGGWQVINQAFRDLPVSSEQIMHPEKYFEERDDPVEIELPEKLLGPEWKQIEDDVLGELNLRVVLSSSLLNEQAYQAAEGWDGDRLRAFEDPSGEVLLVVFTTWDSEKDAQEFFKAYRQLVERKYAEGTPLESEDPCECRWVTEKGLVLLETWGWDVLVMEGAPGELLEGLRKKLWQTKKIETGLASAPEPDVPQVPVGAD